MMPSQFISEEERKAVEAEQIKAFFNETNDQNLAGALVMSLLVYLVHEGIPTWTWQPALFGLYAVTLVRGWLVRQFRRAPASRSMENWGRTQAISGGLSGVCWGVANTAMLAYLVTEYQLVILTVITVAAATNASEGFAYTPPSRAYILASLCPPIIWLLTVGDRLHFILALMLMVFVPMTLWQGHKRNRIFIEAQQLRFGNETLANELKIRRDAAEQANHALIVSATELKRSESVTERERIRLQTILKMASDGIHILDRDGVLVEANDAFLNMLGYDVSVIGKLRVKDWDAQMSFPAFQKSFDSLIMAHGKKTFETCHRRRDGVILDVEINASVIEIEGNSYIYASSRDITARKLAEEQLYEMATTLEKQVNDRTKRLRTISMQLTMTEERERRMLAQELHDNLGQLIAMIKIKLTTLVAGRLQSSIDDIVALVDLANQSSREVTRKLSPPILYSLGFSPALTCLADEMKRLYGLTVHVNGETELKLFIEEIQAMIFRTLRELLINVARHARVRDASLSYRSEGGLTVFVVSDAGCGFDSANFPDSMTALNSFGLSSIYERITNIGGQMQIVSSAGKGTTITLMVPSSMAMKESPTS